MVIELKQTITAAALLSVAACAPGTAAVAPASTPLHPDQLLAPYFDALQTEQGFPQASPVLPLDTQAKLTRIAFGSCNHHDRSQHMWPQIAKSDPQLMLMLGDNVYGDAGYRGSGDMGTFVDAYTKQAAYREFQEFRAQIPMLATWDDHDYGPNDSGGDFVLRGLSERLFENFWHSSEEVRSRPGIYDSVTIGPNGERVQIIMLDTRFFRSPLKELPYGADTSRGRYLPDDSVDTELLGEAQWQWLEQQLAKPADLRLLVSSIQVLTDAHQWEKWGNQPRERERLYEMLSERAESGLLMLSGDRHSAGIYNFAPQRTGEGLWEFTSSSLNLAFVREDASEREPDDRRVSEFYSVENFGLVDIDWQAKQFTMRLMGADGQQMTGQTVSF